MGKEKAEEAAGEVSEKQEGTDGPRTVFIRTSDETYSFRKVVVSTEEEARKVAEYNRAASKDHKSTQRYKKRKKTLSDNFTDPEAEADKGEEDNPGPSAEYKRNFVIRYLRKHTVGRKRDVGVQVLVHGMGEKDYASERNVSYGYVRNVVQELRVELREEYKRPASQT